MYANYKLLFRKMLSGLDIFINKVIQKLLRIWYIAIDERRMSFIVNVFTKIITDFKFPHYNCFEIIYVATLQGIYIKLFNRTITSTLSTCYMH